MFDSDYTINGKHATYLKYLCDSKAFKRYIDVYMTSAAVGVLNRRQGTVLPSADRARIYADAFINEYIKCKELFRTVILSEELSDLTDEERINICFRYRDKKDEHAVPPITDEEIQKMDEAFRLFNSYVLGGIEILYEAFTGSSTVGVDETIDYAYKAIFDQHTYIEDLRDDGENLFRPEY